MSIIKFKKKEYQVVTSCEHNSINIDRANKQITCRDCEVVLDPFDAIMGYSDALDDWAKRLDKYAEDTKRDFARNQIVARRLENKKRTKCHHCDQMTEIKIKEPTLWETHAEIQGNNNV
ncbi:hypothetical protein [Psychrobacter piscatorii]|uniref:Uncharacterized protein n=1 Tax=Psychrobacter piscatorii TaxID=554343 RepID=A0A0T6DTQ0_9GAMM|nr:hypothetical protein [Psychrobacter piscatorii]KRU23265.1 hypothetical protein AS194_04870 [Psychrobacter piscatorii]